jgi:hypothetical protein
MPSPACSGARASGAGRTRTPDFWFWRPAFYQLNYCPGSAQSSPSIEAFSLAYRRLAVSSAALAAGIWNR